MGKFTDTIVINIRSGDGGAGAMSFRREKYIAKAVLMAVTGDGAVI